MNRSRVAIEEPKDPVFETEMADHRRRLAAMNERKEQDRTPADLEAARGRQAASAEQEQLRGRMKQWEAAQQ